MKNFLALIIFLPILAWANPRDTNPTNPDAVYQNDLDLRDMVNSRIQEVDGSICIDNPTLCVNIANSSITVTGDIAIVGDPTITGDSIITGDVDITGVVTQPTQPSFSVYPTTSPLNVTGSNQSYTITFGSEILDLSDDFSGTTFTAPVDATYFFTATIQAEGISSANHAGIFLRVITSNRTFEEQTQPMPTGPTRMSISVSGYDDMDANDTVTVSIQVEGSSKSVDILGAGSGTSTRFSGFLIN